MGCNTLHDESIYITSEQGVFAMPKYHAMGKCGGPHLRYYTTFVVPDFNTKLFAKWKTHTNFYMSKTMKLFATRTIDRYDLIHT